jgi:hypothetical protein
MEGAEWVDGEEEGEGVAEDVIWVGVRWIEVIVVKSGEGHLV